MDAGEWAIGVDLGGTKIEIAQIDARGAVLDRIRIPTNVAGGVEAIQSDIVQAIRLLQSKRNGSLFGVGIGVAGQIEAGTGKVLFAPNLGWHNVPLQENLAKSLKTNVAVTNDVRAAAWGEWLFGAGKGCADLICLFLGTGIGSGIVSGGKMLTGATNSAGEVGHMTISLNGPKCTCGNIGCFEALAGGWGIARQAQEAVKGNRQAGKRILELANGEIEAINAKVLELAGEEGDPLAKELMERVYEAMIAGTVSLVNAFNPQKLIIGGGLGEGFPQVIPRIEEGVRARALRTATRELEILPAALGMDAGVVGAACQLF